MLTLKNIYAVMPGAQNRYAKNSTATRGETYLPWLEKFMAQYDINTPIRIAYFLATIAVESGEMKYSEEIASGARYEGRKDLGNTQKGDGVRFKGRGLIQVTGRTNYTAYSKHVGYDFYSTTERARNLQKPGNATRSACWYWQAHGLNELSERDNPREVRKRVNGGLNGYDQFVIYLMRAKQELGISN